MTERRSSGRDHVHPGDRSSATSVALAVAGPGIAGRRVRTARHRPPRPSRLRQRRQRSPPRRRRRRRPSPHRRCRGARGRRRHPVHDQARQRRRLRPDLGDHRRRLASPAPDRAARLVARPVAGRQLDRVHRRCRRRPLRHLDDARGRIRAGPGDRQRLQRIPPGLVSGRREAPLHRVRRGPAGRQQGRVGPDEDRRRADGDLVARRRADRLHGRDGRQRRDLRDERGRVEAGRRDQHSSATMASLPGLRTGSTSPSAATGPGTATST